MPVEFLTDEQAASYGKFNAEPTRPELERFFFLDDEDRKLIAKRRGDHNRLGFALQMCTVRFIGRFLPDDPLDVPWPVIEHIAEQLGIEDVSAVKQYTEGKPTAYEHAWETRDAYEYHEYEDPKWSRLFRTFLHGRAWTAHAEGPKALFDHAVGWLRRNRVLLPGVMETPEGEAAFTPGELPPAADEDVGHRDEAGPGAGGRDRRVPAGAGEAGQAAAEPAERLSTLPQLEKAARALAKASKVFIEELELIEETGADVDVSALWAALEEVAPRAALSSAAALVVTLVPEDDGSAESAMREALANRYNTVRPFLSLLGDTKMLNADPEGKRILAAVRRLPALNRRRVDEKPLLKREIDDKVVPAAWRKAVYANKYLPQGAVDRNAYVVCVLEQLYRALMRRDIFARPSHRFADPRARLLEGKPWEAVREDVLHGLSLDMPVEQHLAELVRVLDANRDGRRRHGAVRSPG